MANDCDGSAECMDTVGSYKCSCRSGYEGDGFICTGYTTLQKLIIFSVSIRIYQLRYLCIKMNGLAATSVNILHLYPMFGPCMWVQHYVLYWGPIKLSLLASLTVSVCQPLNLYLEWVRTAEYVSSGHHVSSAHPSIHAEILAQGWKKMC